MKRSKIFCALMSFLMIFVVALTGCESSSKVSYNSNNKAQLRAMVESLSYVATEGEELPEETIDEVCKIIEKSLSSANISNKELEKLIALPAEVMMLVEDLGGMETFADIDTVRGVADVFYATGISHTKIATFVYVLTVESIDFLVEEEFIDAEEASYINEGIECVSKKDFVNVTVAVLDSYKLAIYSDFMETYLDLLIGKETSLTKNEIKTAVSQLVKYTEDYNKIWTDAKLKSVATILKNFVKNFAPDSEEKTAALKIVDNLVNYAKVSQKVQLAVVKAIDTKMIDALYGDPTIEDAIIAIGKLWYAATNGTGLTKKLISDSGIYDFSGLSEEISKAEFNEVLDVLFDGAVEFKNKEYGSYVNYNSGLAYVIYNLFFNYGYDIDYGYDY